MLAVGGDTLSYTFRAGATYFTVSELISNDSTDLKYSNKQMTRNRVTSGADKPIAELHPLLKREKSPHNQAPSYSNPGTGRTL